EVGNGWLVRWARATAEGGWPSSAASCVTRSSRSKLAGDQYCRTKPVRSGGVSPRWYRPEKKPPAWEENGSAGQAWSAWYRCSSSSINTRVVSSTVAGSVADRLHIIWFAAKPGMPRSAAYALASRIRGRLQLEQPYAPI